MQKVGDSIVDGAANSQDYSANNLLDEYYKLIGWCLPCNHCSNWTWVVEEILPYGNRLRFTQCREFPIFEPVQIDEVYEYNWPLAEDPGQRLPSERSFSTSPVPKHFNSLFSVVVVVYHLTIVTSRHWKQKKCWPMVMGCVLETAGRSYWLIYTKLYKLVVASHPVEEDQ